MSAHRNRLGISCRSWSRASLFLLGIILLSHCVSIYAVHGLVHPDQLKDAPPSTVDSTSNKEGEASDPAATTEHGSTQPQSQPPQPAHIEDQANPHPGDAHGDALDGDQEIEIEILDNGQGFDIGMFRGITHPYPSFLPFPPSLCIFRSPALPVASYLVIFYLDLNCLSPIHAHLSFPPFLHILPSPIYRTTRS